MPPHLMLAHLKKCVLLMLLKTAHYEPFFSEGIIKVLIQKEKKTLWKQNYF